MSIKRLLSCKLLQICSPSQLPRRRSIKMSALSRHKSIYLVWVEFPLLNPIIESSRVIVRHKRYVKTFLNLSSNVGDPTIIIFFCIFFKVNDPYIDTLLYDGKQNSPTSCTNTVDSNIFYTGYFFTLHVQGSLRSNLINCVF